MSGPVFGQVPGVPVGAIYADREQLSEAGVHRPNQAGIAGSQSVGADSIVVSGGYQDDEDLGDLIVYTGQGGRDPGSGLQIADQDLTRGNLALAKSCDAGLPVRVVRGAGGDPAFSPGHGYRYDGLFFVTRYWEALGTSGFRIWRYRLEREHADPDVPTSGTGTGLPAGSADPPRYSTVQRVVRNTAVTQSVKTTHDHTCQICGVRLETLSGAYAEGCHIVPRGKPHHGPDTPSNVLCLCPNCHVQFDRGTIQLTDNLQAVETLSGRELGALRTKRSHVIDTAMVRRHRALFGDGT